MLRKLLLKVCALCLLVLVPIGYAASEDIAAASDIADVSYDDSGIGGGGLETSPAAATDSANSSAPINELLVEEPESEGGKNISVSTDNFGVNGPLKVAMQYSSGFGVIVKSQWLQALNYTNAMALALDIGSKEYRLNATWGHAFNDVNRIKVSAEYLAQKMDFDFDAGTQTKTIGQGAIGLSYQYLFPKKTVHAFNFNTTYSRAQSKDLGIQYFSDSAGNIFENWQRIAGGTDKSLSGGLDFLPTKSTLLGFDINFDSVKYDEQYNNAADNPNPTASSDTSGFGATINLEQIINNFFKLKLSVSDRKIYNNYKAEVDWLAHTAPNSRLEMNFTGEQISGGSNTDNSGTSNDTRFGLGISYRWGPEAFDQHEIYTLQTTDTLTDLVSWTSTPAVHMEKVLAIVDQKTLKVDKPNLSGLNNIHIPGDAFKQQFPSGSFSYSQDIGVLDLTPIILGAPSSSTSSGQNNFGAHSLQSISAPGLAEFGLQMNLTNGGTTVTLTGIPIKVANSAPITVTAVNAGGVSSDPVTFFLDISSVAPQVLVKTLAAPIVVGETAAQLGNPIIADLIFGGDTITADNRDAINAILNPHNLAVAQFTRPTGPSPQGQGEVTITTTGAVTGITGGTQVPITISTATSSASGTFILIIIDKPAVSVSPINTSTGAQINNAVLGAVDYQGGTPIVDPSKNNGLIINSNANFGDCFDNASPGKNPQISLSGNIISLTGVASKNAKENCVVHGAFTIQDAEGLSSNPVDITLNIVGAPTIIFNSSPNAAKGTPGGFIVPFDSTKGFGTFDKGVGGSITAAQVKIVTPSACFDKLPVFSVAPDSGAITISDGGTLKTVLKNPCTDVLQGSNDQGVSTQANMQISLVNTPVITPNTITAIVGQALGANKAATIDVDTKDGGTFREVNLIAGNDPNFATFFQTSGAGLIPSADVNPGIVDVQLKATANTVANATIRGFSKNSDGSGTFTNVVQALNNEGGTALGNLKVLIVGAPELIAPPAPFSTITVGGSATTTPSPFADNQDWGANTSKISSGSNNIAIDTSFTPTQACFATNPTVNASTKGDFFSLSLSGGSVIDKLNLDKTSCQFKLKATNNVGLSPTSSNDPIFNLTFKADTPTITSSSPVAVIGAQYTSSNPLVLGTVDWKGGSSDHSKSTITVQDKGCFTNSGFTADWSQGSSTTGGSIIVTMSNARIINQGTSCILSVTATNVDDNLSTSQDITVQLQQGTPVITLNNSGQISGPSGSTLSNSAIGTVNWGPASPSSVTISDPNGCFPDLPSRTKGAVSLATDKTTINFSGTINQALTSGSTCTATISAVNNFQITGTANFTVTSTATAPTVTSVPVVAAPGDVLSNTTVATVTDSGSGSISNIGISGGINGCFLSGETFSHGSLSSLPLNLHAHGTLVTNNIPSACSGNNGWFRFFNSAGASTYVSFVWQH